MRISSSIRWCIRNFRKSQPVHNRRFHFSVDVKFAVNILGDIRRPHKFRYVLVKLRIIRFAQYDYDFMEVCSPGVDRPIRNQRDADRCLGLEIEVRLYKPQDGQKAFCGTFTGYENGDITVKCGENERTFLKKDIAVARCTINMDEVENVDLS